MRNPKRLQDLTLFLVSLLFFGCSLSQAKQQEVVEVAKVEIPLNELVRDDSNLAQEAPEGVEFTVPEPDRVSPLDTPTLPVEPDKPVAQAQEAVPSEDEEEIPKRNYEELLKDPKALGFSPSQNLFRNVYYYIKQSYVDEVSEDKLFEGVKSEVANLLTQSELDSSQLQKLSRGRKVLPQLMESYGDKVDRNLLVFSAILGMLDGLEDPYSLLMTPDDYKKLQEQMQARNFGGIGIYIELDRDNGNRLTVFEPIEGTPAYESGLMAGDKIMNIDGESTDGITLDAAQTAIRGPVGTQVVLGIKRSGVSTVENYTVTRGNIKVVSVTKKMLDNQVGYVRLRLFGSDTASELEEAIKNLKAEGAKAIALDLRNNGGGYIDASVNVVGQFLPERDGLVVYTIDKHKRRRDYRASNQGQPGLPIVVLINKFSASASEITAGALRDHKVAKLVGEHSFGKGSVQQLYPFPDGTALKLTIAKFYTPSGVEINKKGIEPDYSVKMEPRYVGRGEKDIQLQKAVEVLQTMM